MNNHFGMDNTELLDKAEQKEMQLNAKQSLTMHLNYQETEHWKMYKQGLGRHWHPKHIFKHNGHSWYIAAWLMPDSEEYRKEYHVWCVCVTFYHNPPPLHPSKPRRTPEGPSCSVHQGKHMPLGTEHDFRFNITLKEPQLEMRIDDIWQPVCEMFGPSAHFYNLNYPHKHIIMRQ